MQDDYFMEVIARLVVTGLNKTEACLLIARLYEQLKIMLS